LVLYDTLLTFDREIRLVWRRKITGASLILLFTRYLYIIRYCLVFFYVVGSSVEWCVSSLMQRWPGYKLTGHTTSVFTAMRVYALTGCNIWLSAIIFVLSTVPFTTNIVMLIFTRLSAIVTDFLVLAITWMKTFSSWRVTRRAALRMSLPALMLRDGQSLYSNVICHARGLIFSNVGTVYFLYVAQLVTSRLHAMLTLAHSAYQRTLHSQRRSLGMHSDWCLY
ncbi:hypothetical protein C8Q80DRAFT_1102579, partial [Daedaleopsis nitida]